MGSPSGPPQLIGSDDGNVTVTRTACPGGDVAARAAARLGSPKISKTYRPLKFEPPARALGPPTTLPNVKVVGKPGGRLGTGLKLKVICDAYGARRSFV
jgi:hypothetical protein